MFKCYLKVLVVACSSIAALTINKSGSASAAYVQVFHDDPRPHIRTLIKAIEDERDDITVKAHKINILIAYLRGLREAAEHRPDAAISRLIEDMLTRLTAEDPRGGAPSLTTLEKRIEIVKREVMRSEATAPGRH